jgi:hypothetical protein
VAANVRLSPTLNVTAERVTLSDGTGLGMVGGR